MPTGDEAVRLWTPPSCLGYRCGIIPAVDRAELISTIPYFRGISPASLARLTEQAQEMHFNPGEYLFAEGEPGRGLYAVADGAVRVTRISSQGREQVLMTAGAGHTINEVSVFDGGPCPATAVAQEPSTVILVPKDAVWDCLKDDPAVAASSLGIMSSRLRSLVALVSDLSHLDVTARVAKALLAQHRNAASSSFNVNQSELAATTGTSREVAARGLKRLEDAGAITRRRSEVEVTDAEILEQAADGKL